MAPHLALTVVFVALAGCGVRTGALSLGGGMFGGGSPEAAEESTGSVPVAASSTSRMSIAAAKPVDAYVMLGGRIKSCWFNADAPLLPNHVYRADVSPDGDKVQITIHEKHGARAAPGVETYAIDFNAARRIHGGDDRESQHAARACRQDAIRHRPLEARRDELQQRDAEGHRSRSRPALAVPILRDGLSALLTMRGCLLMVRPAGGRASNHEATILDRRKEELSRDSPGCGSRASREGRACRSSAASSGIRRRSAYSARKPLRG